MGSLIKKCTYLNKTEHADILQWLGQQPNQSLAIAEALRAMMAEDRPQPQIDPHSIAVAIRPVLQAVIIEAISDALAGVNILPNSELADLDNPLEWLGDGLLLD